VLRDAALPDGSLAQPPAVPNARVIRALALFVGAGAFAYLAAVLWAGRAETLAGIQRVGFPAAAGLALLSTSALLWRFARWHWLLGTLGHRLPIGFNLRVYVAGLALTTSPGKLGETLRSLLLLPRGVPVPHSLGAFLADRLADVIGVCALGVVAALLAGAPPWMIGGVLFALLAGASLVAFALRHPRAAGPWQWLQNGLGERLPVRGGQATLAAWTGLWTLRRVPVYTLLAALAYGTQALVFVAICHRVGVALAPAEGILIFVNATLFGAASLVPGGLGAMEAALVLQLITAGAPDSAAVAIAITTRLLTLWMAIALGVAALGSLASQRPLQQ
jgi:glycosyltransferase 2 family protein